MMGWVKGLINVTRKVFSDKISKIFEILIEVTSFF